MAYGTFNFLGGRLMIPNTGRTPELPTEREGLRLISSSSQRRAEKPRCSSCVRQPLWRGWGCTVKVFRKEHTELQ